MWSTFLYKYLTYKYSTHLISLQLSSFTCLSSSLALYPDKKDELFSASGCWISSPLTRCCLGGLWGSLAKPGGSPALPTTSPPPAEVSTPQSSLLSQALGIFWGEDTTVGTSASPGGVQTSRGALQQQLRDSSHCQDCHLPDGKGNSGQFGWESKYFVIYLYIFSESSQIYLYAFHTFLSGAKP